MLARTANWAQTLESRELHGKLSKLVFSQNKKQNRSKQVSLIIIIMVLFLLLFLLSIIKRFHFPPKKLQNLTTAHFFNLGNSLKIVVLF